MDMYRSWLGTIRNKLVKSPLKRVIVLHSNSNDTIQREVQVVKEKATLKEGSCSPPLYIGLSEDDMAAIKIQAFFRGHLCRDLFGAFGRSSICDQAPYVWKFGSCAMPKIRPLKLSSGLHLLDGLQVVTGPDSVYTHGACDEW